MSMFRRATLRRGKVLLAGVARALLALAPGALLTACLQQGQNDHLPRNSTSAGRLSACLQACSQRKAAEATSRAQLEADCVRLCTRAPVPSTPEAVIIEVTRP